MQTPKQIVEELDQYVIGQNEAKKAVAVALYNRWRRMQLSAKMQQDITPKNLLMIGPTGVGKTEIARRLAKIVQAPFVKVEATKFTEVGYVGRDVESMVRDLLDVAVKMVEEQKYETVRTRATQTANKRLVKLLVPGIKRKKREDSMADMLKMLSAMQKGDEDAKKDEQDDEVNDAIRNERLTVSEQLYQGLLEDRELSVKVADEQPAGMGDTYGQMGIDMSAMLGNMMPKKMVDRTMTVAEAREVFIKEESAKLVNNADIYHDAIKLAENSGIIFIDEIDKIATGRKQNGGGEVSREGVQRDILPIVEGSQVNTKYGAVNTDHVLFIGSGAFAEAKPSDLIAELQGRFPIRVELKDLTETDFIRILTEPDNALTKQYMALIGADGVKVTFTQEAIMKIAHIAQTVNTTQDNIGARRLATILEKLLEDILYEGPDMQMGAITITEKYVDDKVGTIAGDSDISKYIL